MALGAVAADIRAMVFKDVGGMVIAGIALGLPLAYGLGRLSGSLLFGVSAGDATIYLALVAIIAAVAGVACFVPSRRATKIDPLVALRYE